MNPPSNELLLKCHELTKVFPASGQKVTAVEGAELELHRGETVVVRGESGSGKTTLLLMASAMMHPTSGDVRIENHSIYERSSSERRRLRQSTIATLFPTFQLLPYLNVTENVRLARPGIETEKIDELLESLGIYHRRLHRPGQLSTGEQRRVMVARALIADAPLLLADEPTSNLDEKNADIVREALASHVNKGGGCFVVTHERANNFATNTAYQMNQGRLERAGRVSGWGLATLFSMLLVAGLMIMLGRFSKPQRTTSEEPIRLICAAGLKKPIEAIIDRYQEETGREVTVSYGGSGALLGQLKIDTDCADLYLAADDSYVALAEEMELSAESIPLARMRPVVAVQAGNPKQVTGLQDLLRDDLAIGLADPEGAAVGKIAKRALVEQELWDQVATNVKVFKPTVNDIANDLALGTLDIAVVWDSTLNQYDNIEEVPIDTLDKYERTVAICVVQSSLRPTESLKFARYLAAHDRGSEDFAANGFIPIQGDVWEDDPELLVYAGSMFNKPIEQTIREFEKREGVTVNTVFNGCGILVSQMDSGGTPDTYLSCDNVFMDRVADRFGQSISLSENPMVIVVQSGNPRQIQELKDLLQPDLKVGLAHPEKSALGHLTSRLLQRENLWEPIQQSGNWVQEAPTGDFLTNALRTGALDAAVVYRSNAQPWAEEIELLSIDHVDALARQPAAISIDSHHAQLAERFLRAIRSPASAAQFRDYGFEWLASEQDSLEDSDSIDEESN